MVLSHPGDKRLMELLRVLIILRGFYGMAVHDLKIFIQLFILQSSCHVDLPSSHFSFFFCPNGSIYDKQNLPHKSIIELL